MLMFFIVASNNATGLTEADITVSAVDSSDSDISDDVSLVSLEGENSVYKAVVRPMEESGMLTLTIAADAVTEGNAETTQDIRVSTDFPDEDAVSPTLLISVPSPEQIVGICGNTDTDFSEHFRHRTPKIHARGCRHGQPCLANHTAQRAN